MALICFDLDGTLLDPMEGLHGSFRTAYAGLGIPAPSRDEIAPYIGLDLEPLFRGFPAQARREAEARFWGQFAEEGVFAQRIQDGAHLMLERLKRQGHHLCLLTGMPVTHARRAIHHFDLNLIFDDVIGPLPGEGWKPKHEVLKALDQDGVLRAGGLMIGDRADDIQGGHAHGLRTLGLSCGYGNKRELEDAKAGLILGSIKDLDAWLAGTFTDPEIYDPFSRSE